MFRSTCVARHIFVQPPTHPAGEASRVRLAEVGFAQIFSHPVEIVLSLRSERNFTALNLQETTRRSLHDIVKDAHGFAEVYPEHKFKIVKMLMDSGFTCGMTGDGVNDAPALKRAQIGIAVEGATDAARAAADIVLTDPGLKTIIDAILRARKIFARVRNYCIYRISATFQLIFFFFFAVIGFKSTVQNQFPDQMRIVAASKTMFGEMPQEFETVFTLPVMALVAITLLNDGLIISICKDKVGALRGAKRRQD